MSVDVVEKKALPSEFAQQKKPRILMTEYINVVVKFLKREQNTKMKSISKFLSMYCFRSINTIQD